MRQALRADVAIVGTGVSGVAAALEAGRRGARVALLEAAPAPGGTARVGGGGICIAGSPIQASAGIADSPQKALADWLAFGGAEADAAWAERYLEAGIAEVFGFLSEAGVTWQGLREQEGNSVPRWHAPAGGGARVMSLLLAQLERMPNVSLHVSTRVDDLVWAGGTVTGVHAVGSEGPFELAARSVVLACGGFASDHEMVQEHTPAARDGKRVLLAGGPTAHGLGHRLAQAVDAQFTNMDAVWMYPYATVDPDSPGELRGIVLRDLEDDVWVNSLGVRFHNEALRGGASGTPALLKQPGATCWSIIDSRIADRMTVSDSKYRENYRPIRSRIEALLDRSPYITKAPDLATLADRLGIDRGQFIETLNDHNLARRHRLEVDPDFGRPIAGLDPIEAPPFYAIQLFAAARKNLGGVRTDENCQVLTTSGVTVGGLYAVGEVAGMAGGHMNGKAALEGTMFGPSLYSGRVVGRHV